MSSNGVMLQDYVPSAINNVTERIWCGGARIPAGKRVVIGHMRNGWLEVTFTMGPMQDITGMALVPPEVVGVEPAPPQGFGLMPQGVAAMRARTQPLAPSNRVFVQGTLELVDDQGKIFSGTLNGQPVTATLGGTYDNNLFNTKGVPRGIRGWVDRDGSQFYGNVTVTIGQHTNIGPYYLRAFVQSIAPQAVAPAFSRGAIDQNAPLPPRARARARGMGIYPYYMPSGGTRMGPVWPVGMPAVVASSRIRTRAGFGDAGASEFTVKAAEELDEHLTTNGCAGCDDYKSPLRQLAFKFKAACMTDPGVQNQVSFNISTPLAMSAFGSGTLKALKLVLGSKFTYDGGPCTDDNGACLGNLPQIAQVTPVALGPLITQVVNQVNDQIQQHQATPSATQLARQEALVNALVGAATGLFTALSAALASAKPVQYNLPNLSEQNKPAPTPAKSGIPWSTIVIGGLIGTTVLATGAFIYTHARHA